MAHDRLLYENFKTGGKVVAYKIPKYCLIKRFAHSARIYPKGKIGLVATIPANSDECDQLNSLKSSVHVD